MADDAAHGMTPHTSGTCLSAQARYAAGTREILECWFDGRPIREEYLIVDGGGLAGAGATPTARATHPSTGPPSRLAKPAARPALTGTRAAHEVRAPHPSPIPPYPLPPTRKTTSQAASAR